MAGDVEVEVEVEVGVDVSAVLASVGLSRTSQGDFSFRPDLSDLGSSKLLLLLRLLLLLSRLS